MLVVDFEPSAAAADYTKRMRAFLDEKVLPAEAAYEAFRAERRGTPAEWDLPPVVEELKAEARARGLWNLFLPSVSGLSNLEYAPVAEVSGWSPVIAPEAINCAGPGHRQHGDAAPVRHPGAEGASGWSRCWRAEIRSAFAMTEPDVASSDATNVQTSIRRDGDEYVISGRKWWISGTADERCEVFIVMGKTDPEAATHRQQSMVLVPRDTPGLEIKRHLPVFGYQDQHGHSELEFHDVRVPVTNLLGEEGGGFAIAQARLGPGRIHHCMRLIGMCERAIDLMARRAQQPGRVRPAAGRAGRGARADRAVPDRGRAGPAAGAQDGLADRHVRGEGRGHRDRRDQGRSARGWPARSSTGPSRSTAAAG